ncbi:MAG: MoaD/ThiS family protein [Anaerolineales bacterium]
MSVRLHATLRRETPDGMLDRLQLDLSPGATVAAVLAALDLSPDDEHVLLAVNGRVVAPDRPLADGDEVRLMPAMSGGQSPVN